MSNYISDLSRRVPELAIIENDLNETVACLEQVYRKGGKILVCGNGGSAADAEHIVAELMKGFLLKRPLPVSLREKLQDVPPALASALQMGIPAISLVSGVALPTAFANDVCHEAVFAQQVLALGKRGDALLALSTSGNSANVVAALQVAKALGLATIGLSGSRKGKMAPLCDIFISAPAESTPRIQEYHLAIYHALCAELENRLFGNHA